MTTKWVPSEYQVSTKWVPSEYQVTTKWVPSEYQVRTKWVPSEYQVSTKWLPSEYQVSTKWHTKSPPHPSASDVQLRRPSPPALELAEDALDRDAGAVCGPLASCHYQVPGGQPAADNFR